MCTVKKAITGTIATKLPKVAPMPIKKVAPQDEAPPVTKVKPQDLVKVAKNNKARPRSSLRIPTSNLTYG